MNQQGSPMEYNMSQKQMGKTQYLVNKDEKKKYTLLQGDDRKKPQAMKHDLSKNGKYDKDAQKILDKY